MKIKYTGNFIDQYEKAKERKEEIFRLYPEYFEEFSYILGIKPNETKNINIRKKREIEENAINKIAYRRFER